MRTDWGESDVSKSFADRLTWDGWDIHCGQALDVLLPDRLDGGTWRAVSFEYNDDGWYMPGYPGVSPVGLWARESGEKRYELPLY